MATYSFFATNRDFSIFTYPSQILVEAECEQQAIHRLGREYGMKVAELEQNGVWMELSDGALVRYEITIHQ